MKEHPPRCTIVPYVGARGTLSTGMGVGELVEDFEHFQSRLDQRLAAKSRLDRAAPHPVVTSHEKARKRRRSRPLAADAEAVEPPPEIALEEHLQVVRASLRVAEAYRQQLRRQARQLAREISLLRVEEATLEAHLATPSPAPEPAA